MEQKIIQGEYALEKLNRELQARGCRKILLVCGRSFDKLPIRDELIQALPIYVRFGAFSSNPKYEEVVKAVEIFQCERCDSILAVGGGSAIDVAKCVKLFCPMDSNRNYLTQDYRDTGVPLIAIPTTAGTGSESTHFAVIYDKGAKQSVAHASVRPDCAVLLPEVLEALPIYQKKCTMLDALCQGIESWWSVNSTEESMEYSRIAVETILLYQERYLRGENRAAERMMFAANCAGRAINVTQTTAPHAMSYKLTSMYGLPHGHAVSVCLPEVWEYMRNHLEDCADPRGSLYLETIFAQIAESMGCVSVAAAEERFRDLLRTLDIFPPSGISTSDMMILAGSVNAQRLKNNPVALNESVLYSLYGRISSEGKRRFT